MLSTFLNQLTHIDMYSYNLHVIDAIGTPKITTHSSLKDALNAYDTHFGNDKSKLILGAIVVDKAEQIGSARGQIANHILLLGLAKKWQSMGMKKNLMNMYVNPDALKSLDVQTPQPINKTQDLMLRTEWGTYEDKPTAAFLPGLKYNAKLIETSTLVEREGKDVEAAFQGFNLWDADERKPWRLDKTPAKAYTDHETLVIKKTPKAKTVEVVTTCYDRV